MEGLSVSSLKELFKNDFKWTQWTNRRVHTIEDKQTTCYCLDGAIHAVYHESEYFKKAALAKKAIIALFPERVNPFRFELYQFNDHEETTIEDVRKVVELAGI